MNTAELGWATPLRGRRRADWPARRPPHIGLSRLEVDGHVKLLDAPHNLQRQYAILPHSIHGGQQVVDGTDRLAGGGDYEVAS